MLPGLPAHFLAMNAPEINTPTWSIGTGDGSSRPSCMPRSIPFDKAVVMGEIGRAVAMSACETNDFPLETGYAAFDVV